MTRGGAGMEEEEKGCTLLLLHERPDGESGTFVTRRVYDGAPAVSRAGCLLKRYGVDETKTEKAAWIKGLGA